MKMLAQNCSKSLLIILLIGLVFMFNACKGPQGEVGPQGPKGDTGAKGDAGATGLTMFASDWTTPTWSYNSTYKYWLTSIDAPKITKEIIEKGHVEVYYKFNETDVRNLPYLDVNTSNNNTIVNVVTHNLNIGKIVMSSSIKPSGTFRYIIIPNTPNGRMKTIDFSNYEEVKAYYHLKD